MKEMSHLRSEGWSSLRREKWVSSLVRCRQGCGIREIDLWGRKRRKERLLMKWVIHLLKRRIASILKKCSSRKKKNGRKKGSMGGRQILSYRLQHAMTIAVATMMTPLQQKKGSGVVSPPQ
jgi:hypothetical protein